MIYVLEQNTLVCLFLWIQIKAHFVLIGFIVIYRVVILLLHIQKHIIFLTIVDDYSRTIWVYLIHMKFDTFTCLNFFFWPWLKLNSIALFDMHALIMVKNFYTINFKPFFMIMICFTNVHMWMHLNKMASLNVNIIIFLT